MNYVKKFSVPYIILYNGCTIIGLVNSTSQHTEFTPNHGTY